MIKNESVIKEINNKQIEDFYVDGYHRRCFEEGEEYDYIDHSFMELLGYDSDEFEEKLSNHFDDLINEDDRAKYSELMYKLKKGIIAGRIKYRIRTKSGKFILVEENLKSLISCSGKTWTLGIVRKVSEFKEESFEAKYEFVNIEDAPYGIMRCSFEEYPRIEYMNTCMMYYIGASIFNDYKLYAENIFFMISHTYRDEFRDILSKLSTFSDPIFISHNIVKVNGDSSFFSGWGWVEYDENNNKIFSFYYGIPFLSLQSEANKTEDVISSLKTSYNLIIKLNIAKGTAECVHKSVERPVGVSYDVVLTIDSARTFFVTNYIEKDDRASVEKFIDDIIAFATIPDKRNFHTDFSVILDDGSKRRYHAISMKIDESISLICARDITDIKYSSELEHKSNILHKLWRNLNRFNLKNNTEAITFEDRGDYIFPIYCSDNLCKRMSVTESDFYKIAVQGIKKNNFFERLGINEQIYDNMLNHEYVEFMVPDGENGRKSFSAKLIAEEKKIYTAMMFLEREPVEFFTNLSDSSFKDEEENIESDMFIPGNKSKIWIRTFGTFDVFLDGVPIRFPSAKAKELLAILVDRRGGSLTAEQAISYLWEDRVADKQAMSNYRKVAMKLQNTLNKYQIGDIVINNRGVRSLNMGIVDCDYFRYLKKDESIIDVFHGQYMQDYSWGETTLAAMLNLDNLTIE